MRDLPSNVYDTREHNRRVVLQALRRHGTLSRADLARLTGLSAQGVTNIADELLRDRLVRNAGRRRGGRGQPPLDLAIDPTGGTTIGVELRHDAMVVVLADLAGAVLREKTVPLPSADPQTVARTLPKVIRSFTALAATSTTGPIVGVGIVAPWPAGGVSGGRRSTELPGWEELADPAAVLTEALGYDVVIENDAAAAALGEHLLGAGRRFARVACLYMGRGLGLGLVLDGRLYRGATGNAGEIGHVVIEPGGRPCFCGQLGCLERYVSLEAALADLGVSALDASVDAKALAHWLDGAASRLADAIVMIENLFDPDTVLVAGLSPQLVEGVVARLGQLPPPLAPRPSSRVLQGECGPYSAARGAASLPLYGREAPHLATRAAMSRA